MCHFSWSSGSSYIVWYQAKDIIGIEGVVRNMASVTSDIEYSLVFLRRAPFQLQCGSSIHRT